jgi:Na+/proline symporter
MKGYIIKFGVLSLVMILSVAMAKMFTSYPINSWIYLGVIYLGILFIAVHYFSLHDDKNNPNKGIRKIMLGTMIRLFAAVIFLIISVLNSGKPELGFVLTYLLSFLMFLFFDISEMRSKLRPDLEKSKNNSNA